MCFYLVHAGWFAPSSVPATEVFDGDLRWSSGSGITKKRLKEKDFLEINNNHHYNNNNNNTNTNSQISSVDFLQSRSISTGLGLSLDDRRMVSSRESPVLSLFNDEINRELQRQDLEIDRLVKVQVLNLYFVLLFSSEILENQEDLQYEFSV